MSKSMDLDLLRQLGALARAGSLELAGEQLHLTASAVSRSMRRLEAALDTPLFDRHGRALQLNAAGRRLLEESLPLLAQAERIAGSFKGTASSLRCRIAGPARLHAHFARVPLQKLKKRYPKAEITFSNDTQDSALQAVVTGDAQFAVLANTDPLPDSRLRSLSLGLASSVVAISAAHALGARRSVPVREVMQHDFVVPLDQPRSATDQRGDGWRDDVFPRRHAWRTDDLLVAASLVRAGVALAYLPDKMLPDLQLHRLLVTGCPYRNVLSVSLVWREDLSAGWMQWLTGQLSA
jgi:DNA-binding transcriptional LysR family regulator